jgi:phosphate starvation-inducible membrane PsiE
MGENSKAGQKESRIEMPELTDIIASSNKPKVRLSIKISLALSIIILILILTEAVAFYIYFESGGLNTTWGNILAILFPSCFSIPFIGLFAIICIIISTFKKPIDVNFTISVASLVIALIAGFSQNFINCQEPLRYWAHYTIDFKTLKLISEILPQYAKDHEGRLPLAENWYESLLDYADNSMDPNIKYSPRSTYQRRFALNLGVVGMPLSEIDHNTVLVFEANCPKGLVGGPESITAGCHSGKGSVILFADKHIAFVRAEDFNNLRWKP